MPTENVTPLKRMHQKITEAVFALSQAYAYARLGGYREEAGVIHETQDRLADLAESLEAQTWGVEDVDQDEE